MDIIRAIFFLIMIVAGIFGVFAGIKAYRFRKKIGNWLQTDLIHIDSELVDPEWGTKESPGDKAITVKYRFRVGNQEFSGKHADAFEILGHRHTSLKRQAEKTRKLLRSASKVYYDPSNPDCNFIILPSGFRAIFIILASFFLLLFSLIALLTTLADVISNQNP